MPMLRDDGPPVGVDTIRDARERLHREYGYEAVTERGRKVLLVRSPNAKPDYLRELPTVALHVALDDLKDVRDVLLVGTDKTCRVDPISVRDRVRDQLATDAESIKDLRRRLGRDYGATVTTSGPNAPRVAAVRLPRRRLTDLTTEDIVSARAALRPLMAQKGTDVQYAYVVADDDYERMPRRLLLELVEPERGTNAPSVPTGPPPPAVRVDALKAAAIASAAPAAPAAVAEATSTAPAEPEPEAPRAPEMIDAEAVARAQAPAPRPRRETVAIDAEEVARAHATPSAQFAAVAPTPKPEGAPAPVSEPAAAVTPEAPPAAPAAPEPAEADGPEMAAVTVDDDIEVYTRATPRPEAQVRRGKPAPTPAAEPAAPAAPAAAPKPAAEPPTFTDGVVPTRAQETVEENDEYEVIVTKPRTIHPTPPKPATLPPPAPKAEPGAPPAMRVTTGRADDDGATVEPAVVANVDAVEALKEKFVDAGYEVMAPVDVMGRRFDIAAHLLEGKRILVKRVDTLTTDEQADLAKVTSELDADVCLVVADDVEAGVRVAAWGTPVEVLEPSDIAGLGL